MFSYILWLILGIIVLVLLGIIVFGTTLLVMDFLVKKEEETSE